jgi:hypothetical protein
MSLNERYNILHKKLRDLESVHDQGKRTVSSNIPLFLAYHPPLP